MEATCRHRGPRAAPARNGVHPTASVAARWVAAAILAFPGIAAPAAAPASAAAQRVTIRTDDGVSLAASWYEPGARPGPAVILVHMLHKSRHDWEPVATRLAAEGIGALAIDLRGHGDSGGGLDRGDIPDYSTLVRDISAARRYLASRGDVHQSRVGIAGASMGANLAALAAAGDSGVASLALLSPSLDYRGLRIEAAVRKYGARPALLVSSDDDPYSSRTVQDLKKAGGGIREALVLSRAGHGTVMLGRDQDLARTLVDWFRRTLL
jgi:alpha-beta hydrolase superfamily lysophospholipase